MKTSLFFLFISFTAVTIKAQRVRVPQITGPGVDIKLLNGKTISSKSLETRIASIADSAGITGLQVVIINHNYPVWTKSFGYKNTETKTLLNDSTIMYGASLTKPVSAYLFLRLVDKGIFDLDTPVYKYLKQPVGAYEKWQDLAQDVPSFKKITARMILSHTSGMPILRFLYNDKLNLIAKPGTKFYYSNEAMNFIGFIIEEHTGKRLETLAAEEVFMPLGMRHSSMIWEPGFLSNFSTAYFKDGTVYGSERKMSSRAAGSMSTTATDYAKFIVELSKQQGLSKKLFKEFLEPQIPIISTRGFGPARDSLTTAHKKTGLSWGLGTGLINTSVGKAFFHAGHGEANQNFYIAYPSKGTAVVMLSNSANFEAAAAILLKATIGDSSAPLEWLGYFDN
ncbi:MAG: serine hydrolase domain-containing protein [Bacteroidota bacterium]